MTKPNIQDVYNAFHQFSIRALSIGRTVAYDAPKKWQSEMDKNRATLKADLERLGLAEHIDWSNQEE